METLTNYELEERLEELEEMEEMEEMETIERNEILKVKDYFTPYQWYNESINFIPEVNFVDYATDVFNIYCDVPKYVLDYIDYEVFASDLEKRFTSIDFMGNSYLCEAI